MGGAGDQVRPAEAPWLVNRLAEQALITKYLDDTENGATILIRGPAGIGKTALAENAMRQAGSSRQILRTTGTSQETELAMAGLYQLLQPLFPLATQRTVRELMSFSSAGLG